MSQQKLVSQTSGRLQSKRPDPTRQQKVKALGDFWAFVDLINFQGGSKRFSQCHRDLITWYMGIDNEDKRTLVELPRGHLKSTLLTVASTLWDIYANPNIRIFVGTATRSLATAFVREIKQYLEDPWLQEHVWNARPHIEGPLIPRMDRLGATRKRQEDPSLETEAEDRKIIWRTDAIQVLRNYVLKEPTVTVGSVGSQATGYHYDKLKLDDCVTFENGSSPLKKERLENWLADLESVLDPAYVDTQLEKQLPQSAKFHAQVGGHISVVGTRYAADDWYGQIEDALDELNYKLYQQNIYKNGVDNADGYLWPEKWNEELERKTRSRMNTRRFASQYLNKIIADENAHLKLSDVTFVPASSVLLKDGGQVQITLPKTGEVVSVRLFLTVDPAAAVQNRSDYTAIAVGGRDPKKRLFIVDGDMGRWPTTEIIKRIYKLADAWKLRAVHVEMVGGFKHLAGAMKMSFSQYRPIGILDHKPKGSKEDRIINTLEPIITNGLLYLPEKFRHRRDIVDQFDMFGSQGMHDDFPDAVEMLADVARPPLPKATSYLDKRINTKYGGFR